MKTINILHIEDDLDDAGLVARELTKAGLYFSQTIVSTKEEFLKSIGECKPDIILSDHSLPEFNSLEALRLVQQHELYVPFILITGNSSEEFAVSVIKEGADDYILKDRMKRLPAAVKNALKKYEDNIIRKRIEKETRKKEAETRDEMQKLTNRLRLATKSAAMGIWEWDIKENVLMWDEGMFELYKVDNKNNGSASEGWRSRLHLEDRARINNDLKLAVNGKKEYNTEFRIIWPDLSIRYIKTSGIIERDKTGNAIRLTGANWDITKEKMAEFAIKESETKYRSLVENSMDAILLTTKDGKIISANGAACDMFKLTVYELCNSQREIIDETDSRLAILLNEKILTGRANGELTFIRKDGSKFLGETNYVVFTDAHQEEKTSITIRDISARKAAEQLTKDSQAFTRGVLDSLTSHIAVINSAGTIVNVNKSWNTFALDNGVKDLGKTSEGINYFKICENADDNETAASTLKGLKEVLNGKINEFYLEYPCHSPEEERWFFLRVTKFNSIEPLVLIEHQYITERKKSEEKLETTSGVLKHTLKELNNIMDSSLDIICSIDGQGKLVNLSAASEHIWGYQPHELIGKSILDLVFKEDMQISTEVAAKVIKGHSVTMFENRHIHKNGSIVPLLWSARWDANRQMMYCIAKDATEKKKLEKKIEFERNRIYDLFYHAPLLISVFRGPNYVIEMANQLSLQLFPNKNLVGNRLVDTLPEVAEQGFIKTLDYVYKTGKHFNASEALFRFNNTQSGQIEEIYLNLSSQPYYDVEGAIEGIFFFAVDVTEQVLSRKKIELSEQKYRQIVDTANEGIWMTNEKHQTIFTNEVLCKMLGYTAEEMVGVPLHSFINKEDRKSWEAWSKKEKNGNNEIYDTRLITKNGKALWASLSINSIINSEGKYTGALAMVTDFTDRKRAEELLAENREQLIESQRIAHIGSWHANITENYHIGSCPIFCSDETFRIFGFRPYKGDVRYNFFSKYIHPEDRSLIKNSIQQLIKTDNSSYQIDFRIIDKQGNIKWVHFQAKVVKDITTTRAAKLFGTVKDITIRKNQELKIEKNNKEREILITELTKTLKDLKQFSFITSHNFRAPLSNLLGLLSLVDTNTLTTDNKEVFDMLKSFTSQLTKTIDDLVKILIIKNEVNVDIAQNSISQLIENMHFSFSQEIKTTKCTITKQLQVENILFNKPYLESILSNLVSNALKYYEPERNLHIDISTIRTEGGDVLMSVKDNGTGIDLNRHHDKIFGLYQRFHTNKDSVGLGLFIVKSQVNALGGEITVESEPGKGTCFKILFKQEIE